MVTLYDKTLLFIVKNPSMLPTTTNYLTLFALLAVLAIQLEYLFHMSSLLLSLIRFLAPSLYVAFCVLFLIAIYYLFQAIRVKSQAEKYKYLKYKSEEQFER